MAPAQLHLGVALDGAGWHPAAWRAPNSRPAELFSPGYWTDLVTTAQRGLLDFVSIEDSMAVPGERHAPGDDAVDRVGARIDANLIAARVAPVTQHIGLIPTVTTTHTEPFHVSKSIATLDYTSRGRAGWQVRVSGTPSAAAHFGRRELRDITAAELAEAVASGIFPNEIHEPYELARQLASLDHLSDGRAAWNVVTSFDAFTGQNFRRGGFLDPADRYARAEETLNAVRALWDSWDAADLVADKDSGRFLARPDAGAFAFHGNQFDISGRFTVPRSPQGRPVILQAGVSPKGRAFAAANADAIFSPYGKLPEAADFYRDIKARAVAAGRAAEDIKILPSASFVLGDTEAEATEKFHAIRNEQVTGQTALILLEQIWNRDLSGYDPEGPVPDIDPNPDAAPIIQGRAFVHQDRFATVERLRQVAEAKKLTLREVVIDQFERGPLVGTPAQVAEQIDTFVQNDGSDGFILGSHLVPWGLDEFVDKVVPLLQDRGTLRTEYTGTTLRANLGLPDVRSAVSANA
ncbi:NtaA/DmoA family FMN-dependent monooxygenase [Nocardia sp. NPDC004604]|uniref:NtaA/DmoA family FMN-dependent monooxygenase n=1 Tax=Nocardia sp. NPDC004604 TaxID=3157013 RepID=UPI0033AA5516